MRAFQPSPAFVAFFNQMIAAAEAPVIAGSFTVEIPTFANPQEQAFANTILLGLAQSINAMRASITPTIPNPYALDPVTQQPLYPEAWGTSPGAP